MEKPLVTILVPTFNPDPAFLRQALDSVLHQTEQRFTVCINDDASQSDTEGMVQPYLTDPRFSFRRNVKRLGIGGNWNTCLGEARRAKPGAPFIQFLFQDDRWYFNYLHDMLTMFDKNPTVGFASSDHLYECEKTIPTECAYDRLRTFKNGHVAPGVHHGKPFLCWWLTHGLHPNVIGEPSFVLMRREVVERAGTFRQDMPQFLDVEYWTRLLLTTTWYYHPEELGVFNVHRNGASFRNDLEGTGIFDRFRCFITLKQHAPRDLYPKINHAQNTALKGMIEKFFHRTAHKKKMHMSGSGMLQCFCLRHPILISKTVATVLWERLAK